MVIIIIGSDRYVSIVERVFHNHFLILLDVFLIADRFAYYKIEVALALFLYNNPQSNTYLPNM